MGYTICEAKENEKLFITEELIHFNLERAPITTDYYNIPIAYVVKKEGKVVGGIIGKIYRACLAIDILWLDESVRKTGLGRKLMARAEKVAVEESCLFIHLDTFSFQALGFYEKLGFKVFGVLEGYPDDVKRYYLKKDLIHS